MMNALIASRVWSIASQPGPEHEQEVRRVFMNERRAEVAALQHKLARLQSVRPFPPFRSVRRLDRRKTKLGTRLRRLEHELSILEEA